MPFLVSCDSNDELVAPHPVLSRPSFTSHPIVRPLPPWVWIISTYFFTLALPLRLVVMADALLGMDNIDFLHLLACILLSIGCLHILAFELPFLCGVQGEANRHKKLKI
jgi:hypothetical protein